jgi:hypothetical protein
MESHLSSLALMVVEQSWPASGLKSPHCFNNRGFDAVLLSKTL